MNQPPQQQQQQPQLLLSWPRCQQTGAAKLLSPADVTRCCLGTFAQPHARRGGGAAAAASAAGHVARPASGGHEQLWARPRVFWRRAAGAAAAAGDGALPVAIPRDQRAGACLLRGDGKSGAASSRLPALRRPLLRVPLADAALRLAARKLARCTDDQIERFPGADVAGAAAVHLQRVITQLSMNPRPRRLPSWTPASPLSS